MSEEDNPDNFVRLMLPGAQGERDDLSSFFFRKWKSTMELWRRQMHYPPKQSDLWRMAKELNLFGYEVGGWDWLAGYPRLASSWGGWRWRWRWR